MANRKLSCAMLYRWFKCKLKPPKNGQKYHDNHDENTLRKMVYGPAYVPYNEDGQKILLPQTTDMSRKDNLKLLYNSLPEVSVIMNTKA